MSEKYSRQQSGETYERETDETLEEFQTLIAELLKLDGIEIEIIDCFVWLLGGTKLHKERLKELAQQKEMLVQITGRVQALGRWSA